MKNNLFIIIMCAFYSGCVFNKSSQNSNLLLPLLKNDLHYSFESEPNIKTITVEEKYSNVLTYEDSIDKKDNVGELSLKKFVNNPIRLKKEATYSIYIGEFLVTRIRTEDIDKVLNSEKKKSLKLREVLELLKDYEALKKIELFSQILSKDKKEKILKISEKKVKKLKKIKKDFKINSKNAFKQLANVLLKEKIITEESLGEINSQYDNKKSIFGLLQVGDVVSLQNFSEPFQNENNIRASFKSPWDNMWKPESGNEWSFWKKNSENEVAKTSYKWGKRRRIGNLDKNYMNKNITISEEFARTYCGGDQYYFQVSILDKDYKVIKTAGDGIKKMSGACVWEDNWKKEVINIKVPATAVYLVVEDGGVDSEWWAGYYGIQIRNFSYTEN